MKPGRGATAVVFLALSYGAGCGKVLPCMASSQCAADELCSGGTCVALSAGGNGGGGAFFPSWDAGAGGASSSGAASLGSGTSSSPASSQSSSGHGVVDCPHEASFIYTVDQDGRFSSFDPSTLTFHDVAILSCPSTGTPFSMAVSRTGVAYVVFSTGELFTVNIRTAACTATSFVPDQNGMHAFGMAFSTNAPGSTLETLFLAGNGLVAPDSTAPQPLATLNLQTLAVAPQGMVVGSPELSGRSDATLWSFTPGANARIQHLDKLTGSVASTFPLPSLVGTPTSYAFSFWGGAFWVFLAAQGQTTNVYRVDGVTGAVATSLAGTGRNVVGAGVATCAPLQ